MAFRYLPAALAAVAVLCGGVAGAKPAWPALDTTKALGGGEKDAVLIAAAERYAFVSPVDGAVQNGQAWYEHLVRGRGVPVERVRLLRDRQVTREKILRFAAEAADAVEPGGTLWLVFIGHGAPAKSGDDGLLVGIDVQQEADSLASRSVRREELLELGRKSRAASVVVLLDACFSGRSSEGKALVPGLQPLVVVRERAPLPARLVVLTAAQGDEFAGALPGAKRPAFSYLALGALRGWADADGDGRVTGKELFEYASRALRTLITDRTQTPSLSGGGGHVLGTAFEKGPDLASMVLRGDGAQPALSGATPPLGSATTPPAEPQPSVEPAAAPSGMVAVPAGPFLRGADAGDEDERPARQLTLRAFSLDRTEVSLAAYTACVSAGACRPPIGTASADPRLPVSGVTWHDASAYCAFAKKRLPTEAEWEKAARGTTGRLHPWGDVASCLRANFDVCGAGGPKAVGSFPDGASPYGALDLAGNVWEWVADWYDASAYASAPAQDPVGPATGTVKVIRGGAFDTMAPTLRTSYRGRAEPASRHRNVGFRCAQDG